MNVKNTKKIVADKIIRRLNDLGINRLTFSTMMKVPPSVITKWLSGANNFQANTLFEIERVLEISFFNYNQTKMSTETVRELTFGEKAVGLTFNPGGHALVNEIKTRYAAVIDLLNEARQGQTGEIGRMFSVAITEAQTSQMWAVKAATWQY